VAGGVVPGLAFDLVHAHDWQAAMAPAYLRFARRHAVPSVMTIHNMAFQGYYGPKSSPLGLPTQAWAIDGVEYHGGVGFLKAGMESAARSPRSARPMPARSANPRSAWAWKGLIAAGASACAASSTASIRRCGTRKPIRHLVQSFLGARWPGGGQQARAGAEFGLDQDDGPLFVCVTRLTWQKGIDVLLEVIDHLVGLGGRLALLGAGDPALEARCTRPPRAIRPRGPAHRL
jgi:starch synthase